MRILIFPVQNTSVKSERPQKRRFNVKHNHLLLVVGWCGGCVVQRSNLRLGVTLQRFLFSYKATNANEEKLYSRIR